jgi:hypothetical protein
MANFIICVDFDGCICHNEYPEIGERNPYALKYLKLFAESGAKLILYTMRDKEFLDDAVDYLESNGVTLYGVNVNKQQKYWTTSNKIFGHIYIDDRCFGMPLKFFEGHDRPVVDWKIVGPAILKRLHDEGLVKKMS